MWFSSTSLEPSTDVASEIDFITLRFEIPFALETVGESFLDLTDDDGDNELAMDDDIFGRDPEDPDEDLDDLLDSFRGSSAELVMRLKNNTGFGATLAMVNGADTGTSGDRRRAAAEAKQDPSNWVVDLGIEPAESLQQVQLDISAATLDEFIDGVPDVPSGVSQFAPEFLIELPYDSTAEPAAASRQPVLHQKGRRVQRDRKATSGCRPTSTTRSPSRTRNRRA